MRKVRGEANPGDLFTKHSLSRERIETLVKLFSCEFRGGRAASAPQLRRQGTLNDHGVCVVAMSGGTINEDDSVPEARLHDPGVLPHHYSDNDIDTMFPKAVAPRDAFDTYCDVEVDASGRFTGVNISVDDEVSPGVRRRHDGTT